MVSYEYEMKNAYIGEFSPYTPNANTLLYLSFDGNLNNNQGKTITGSGISYELTGINKSVKLTDISGVINGPGNLMSSVGTGDYAVSLRVKPTNGGNAMVFGNWYEDGSSYPGVQIFFLFGTAFGTSNKVIGLTGNSGGNWSKITSTMSATSLVGAWHNIVMTRISGVVYLYIDNVLQGQMSYGTTMANCNTQYILNRTGGQNWSNTGALMDELIVEKAGWTVSDISNYYTLTESKFLS